MYEKTESSYFEAGFFLSVPWFGGNGRSVSLSMPDSKTDRIYLSRVWHVQGVAGGITVRFFSGSVLSSYVLVHTGIYVICFIRFPLVQQKVAKHYCFKPAGCSYDRELHIEAIGFFERCLRYIVGHEF